MGEQPSSKGSFHHELDGPHLSSVPHSIHHLSTSTHTHTPTHELHHVSRRCSDA